MKLLAFLLSSISALTPLRSAEKQDLLRADNLVAWCIVPFDAKKRGPTERAEMLERLGLRKFAYDWRAEHVPTFDAEVEAMKKHGIEFSAWWFPTTLDADARIILDVIARHKITPQLWVSGGGAAPADEAARVAQIESETRRIKPIATEAARLGCKVGLYNHGGWFGQPENQLFLIARLEKDGIRNVGIVYNFHHGHEHIARFAEIWKMMMPHLLAVNLNGMEIDADTRGRKILHLAEGDRELGLLRIIRDSSWQGPVGIIDHRPETDSEVTLKSNLRGLEWLKKELATPGSAGPPPSPPKAAGP